MRNRNRILGAKELLLTLAQYGQITQDQIICILKYIEDSSPDLIIQEEAICGCALIEELISKEIPIIIFRPKLTNQMLIGKINSLKGGPFEKVILICKIDTLKILGEEFKNNTPNKIQDGTVFKLSTEKNSQKIQKKEIPMQSAME